MDSPGLVAASHGRDELPVLHGQLEGQSGKAAGSIVKICRVCGDAIGPKEDGEAFVACYECGFPVCRPCYEYERSEGNQTCPQCNTRYKRHKGCPRVEGDEDDVGDIDDFEDEFQLKSPKPIVDHHRIDLYSENGDQVQQLKPNVPTFSSFTPSVAGKDLEGERDNESNLEWKDRVEKWKAKQVKRGLIGKDDGGNDDQDNEDDYMLLQYLSPHISVN